jgi:hypothetical protein
MRVRLAAAVLAATLVPAAAAASPVKILTTETATAFLQGHLDDVAVDTDGILTLARRAERVATIGEPFAFSFAVLPDGWAVGTGNDGKVLEVGKDGQVTTLLDAAEPVVFALWADPDGTLYAGTSPHGKVYRISHGKAEEFFAPGEVYIWALARGADGALWVATGTEGRLYRVDAAGKGTLVYDSEDAHLRSLLPLPGGDLLLGTAPAGRVLRFSPATGSARTVYDSGLSEVVAFAPAPGGATWAAVLASEASLLESAPKAPSAPAPAAQKSGSSDADDEPQPVVTVTEGDATTTVVAAETGSRPAGATGPRSELVRIGADGRVEPVWTSADETVFALASVGEELWMGTGLDGKLYRVEGDRVRVEKDFDERQIVGVATGGSGPAILTTNAASVWRFTGGPATKGSYTSAALDAGQGARFGVFRWSGELPDGAGVAAQFRSGSSAEPDRTWSEWTPAAAGREIPLAAVPRGRYVQYRLALTGGGAHGPRVTSTEISCRQDNLRPRIDRLVVLDPGQLLVPVGFNPGEQVFEPASPNRDGIFTTLEPALPRDERFKTVWKSGWQTLRWKASDPNGDKLEFRLEVRPEEQPDGWLEIAHGVDEDHYGFDASVLPDGRYRFRLTASDRPANDAAEALSAVEVSEAVTVDHTAPLLRWARREGHGARLSVYDAGSPLRQAEISIDGGEWRPLAAADGMVDGQSEELVVDEIPQGARFVIVRVSDAAFNLRAIDLLAELGR